MTDETERTRLKPGGKVVAHPARFSTEILVLFRFLLPAGTRVHDPFAGTGERLGDLADERQLVFTGTELERAFIVDQRVKQGNACDVESYPAPGFTVATSPVYPNGMCLAREHRILTRDLRWVAAGDLVEGDQLLAFDESSPGRTANGQRSRRRYQWSTVTASSPDRVECVRVVLDDGTDVIATPDHPWLAQGYSYGDSKTPRGWIQSRDLMGSPVTGAGPTRTGYRQPSYVLRQFDVWRERRDYDAGWLAGMFDGEGHLVAGGVNTAPKLGMTQKPGPLMDRAEQLLTDAGFVAKRYAGNAAETLLLSGSWPIMAEFLGTFRPARLLEKWENLAIDRFAIQPRPVQVVAVEPVGMRDIQRLTTSTGTYIGEGFLMHNSDDYNAQERCTSCKSTGVAADGQPCGKCKGTGRRGHHRRTYRSALAKMAGHDVTLDEDNQARWGYRGRPLSSPARLMYWSIADRAVIAWTEAGAERVLLNVSDFTSNHGKRVEPVVDTWARTMMAHGWTVTKVHKVPTRRFRDGANSDQRAEYEVILDCRRT